MSASPISQLPQEVVDKIIDEVDATSQCDGKSTIGRSPLGECALVCRSFLLRSRCHLFSHVAFDSDRIDSFHRILAANFHIANYVRSLELRPNHGDCNWIWKDQQFIEIMDKVTRPNTQLQALKIRTQYGIQALLEGELLLQVFIQPYVAPYITSLDTDGLFDVPVEVITSCRNLNTLRLRWTSLVAGTSPSHIGSEIPPPLWLQKFEYTDSPDGLSDLLGLDGARPCVNISGLHSLSIGIEPLSAIRNLKFEERIIQATFGSLEKLHIKGFRSTKSCTIFDMFIDLQSCPQLRDLELDVKFELEGRRDGEHFAMISRILSTIPQLNSMEYFRLVARIGTGHWSMDRPEALLGAGWKNLCSHIQRIAHGGKFVFCLHISFVHEVNRGGSVLDGDIILPSDMLCDPAIQKVVWDRFRALQEL